MAIQSAGHPVHNWEHKYLHTGGFPNYKQCPICEKLYFHSTSYCTCTTQRRTMQKSKANPHPLPLLLLHPFLPWRKLQIINLFFFIPSTASTTTTTSNDTPPLTEALTATAGTSPFHCKISRILFSWAIVMPSSFGFSKISITLSFPFPSTCRWWLRCDVIQCHFRLIPIPLLLPSVVANNNHKSQFDWSTVILNDDIARQMAHRQLDKHILWPQGRDTTQGSREDEDGICDLLLFLYSHISISHR